MAHKSRPSDTARNDSWMAYRYACLRQLRDLYLSDDQPPLPWPTGFDSSIIRAAVEDIVDKAEVRSIKRDTLIAEIDGMSVPEDSGEDSYADALEEVE